MIQRQSIYFSWPWSLVHCLLSLINRIVGSSIEKVLCQETCLTLERVDLEKVRTIFARTYFLASFN